MIVPASLNRYKKTGRAMAPYEGKRAQQLEPPPPLRIRGRQSFQIPSASGSTADMLAPGASPSAAEIGTRYAATGLQGDLGGPGWLQSIQKLAALGAGTYGNALKEQRRSGELQSLLGSADPEARQKLLEQLALEGLGE